jgi:hypothetical protein
MAGGCTSGAGRRGVMRWHAVPRAHDYTRRALCGARPSIQWGGDVGAAVTCARCRQRMAADGGGQ